MTMHLLLYFISAGLIIGVACWLSNRRERGHLNEIERLFVVLSAFIATCYAFAGYMSALS
jgi:high-affinity Fe2+/Pb2+ permease